MSITPGYSKAIVLFFLLFSLLQLRLQPVAVKQVWAKDDLEMHIKRLEQQYDAMKDFQAHFKQETHLSSLQQVEEGQGVVYFKKGGKMLWEYTAPSIQKFILDGKNLWVYLPEDNQVMKNDSSRIPADISLGLFSGKLNLRETFKVSVASAALQRKKDAIVFDLIPITYQPSLKRATIWIDTKKYHIYKSQIEDEFGNITMLEFSKIEIDKGIDDSIFMFTPPPGVEIFEPPPLSPKTMPD